MRAGVGAITEGEFFGLLSALSGELHDVHHCVQV